MKKLLALLLALLLAGCAAAPAAPEENNLQPQAMPEVQKMAKQSQAETLSVRYEAETVLYSGTECAKDGTKLVNYTLQVPMLRVRLEDGSLLTEASTPEEEQALALAETFNERFVVWYDQETIRSLVDSAKEDLAFYNDEEFEWYGGYTLDLNCTIYQTDRFISVSGIYCSYTGGAHPNTYMLGWTFDLESGSFFNSELLADEPELKEAVANEIIRQAHVPMEDGIIPAEWYWEDYETIAADWACYAVTFDEAGMTVTFSPYEIAAYAFGPQVFTMSYEFLEPYLSEHAREVLGFMKN